MFVNLRLKTQFMGNGCLIIIDSNDFTNILNISWQSLKSNLKRLDQFFVQLCIATACKKSDFFCSLQIKIDGLWSHPQVKICWETKQLDESFL